jgi:predicted DNA-binding transcriptional regulator YafY
LTSFSRAFAERTSPTWAVVPAAPRPEEEQFLDVVEQSASDRIVLAMKYYTAGRGDVGDRHVSVHRVLLGLPARIVATCHRSNTLKTFRVDSIIRARLDRGEPFRSVEDAAVAYLKASVDGLHGEPQRAPPGHRETDTSRWSRGKARSAIACGSANGTRSAGVVVASTEPFLVRNPACIGET